MNKTQNLFLVVLILSVAHAGYWLDRFELERNGNCDSCWLLPFLPDYFNGGE